jgi:hypothetical protein
MSVMHERPRSPVMTATAPWRQAGMSYLRYTNTCAAFLRRALRDGPREAALARERSSVRINVWDDGKPTAPGAWGVFFFFFFLFFFGFFFFFFFFFYFLRFEPFPTSSLRPPPLLGQIKKQIICRVASTRAPALCGGDGGAASGSRQPRAGLW